MELYFIDCHDEELAMHSYKMDLIICRGNGFKTNRRFFEDLANEYKNGGGGESGKRKKILTNDETAMKWADLFYDRKEGKWKVFFGVEGKWVAIWDLTDKELMPCHSLEHLYKAGAFTPSIIYKNNGNNRMI